MTAIWATPEQVLAATGVTATVEQISRAQLSIETLVGVVGAQSVGLLNTRDLYWLQSAVCFQTAWLNDQPDAFLRNDDSSVSQDGISVTHKADALVLAPFARRAIKRLSWRGTRSVAPTPAGGYVRAPWLDNGYGVAYGLGYGGTGPQGSDDDIPATAWRPM